MRALQSNIIYVCSNILKVTVTFIIDIFGKFVNKVKDFCKSDDLVKQIPIVRGW